MASKAESVGPDASPEHRNAMGILARVGRNELEQAWSGWPDRPAFEVLKKPEIGLVMLRGRTGGSGSPFNLGEATVTRAVVRLSSGELGFAHILGREPEKALLAAVFHALWQTSARNRVEQVVLCPARARLAEVARRKQRETAATRVDFFTLVRGED